MGKATIDLPDPLKQTGKALGKGSGGAGEKGEGTGLGNTDDLLSQLAGDEIDRMLAEADVDRPETGAAAPAAVEAGTPIAAEGAAAEAPAVVDELVGQESAAGAVVSDEAPPEISLPSEAIQAVQGEVGAELDALFEQLNSGTVVEEAEAEEVDLDGGDDEVAATSAQVAADATVPVKSDGKELDSSAAILKEMEADERAKAEGEAKVVSAETLPAAEANAAAGAPAWMRPLIWMNAPFDAIPEGVRNALGQIGIVTMINAVAVLLYVWLFRGKH